MYVGIFLLQIPHLLQKGDNAAARFEANFKYLMICYKFSQCNFDFVQHFFKIVLQKLIVP